MFIADYPPFRPFQWLSNRHLQTVASFFTPVGPSKNPTQRYVVRTPDDDVMVIHDNIPKNWITGDRIAILVHGLCGSHRSTYIRRACQKLRREGFRTIRVDQRGVGDAELLSRGHAHAAAVDDLKVIVEAVHQLSPLSPLTLIGFSLGGNLVLNTVGQWGAQHPLHVDSAVAIAPPIDLTYCTGHLRQWGNRIYDAYFCTKLKRALEYRRRMVPELYDNGLTKLPGRLVHFDDQFVAPVSGFSGAREYYQAASSGPVLGNIEVPTLIIAAEDDPLVPSETFKHWVVSPLVDLLFARHGGHLGFIGPTRGDPDSYWMDWRLIRWIVDHDRYIADQRVERHGRCGEPRRV